MTTQSNTDSNAKSGKSRGLILVALAYLSALVAAWATLSFVPIEGLLYRTLAADVVATFVVFGWSVAYDNSSFYDPYWSLVPIAIVLYWMNGAEASDHTLRTLAILLVVTAWGLRLTFNWARGWTGLDHEDWRYQDFRKLSPRFYWAISLSGIHLFPTAIVFAGMAALFPALVGDGLDLGPIDILATTFGVAGFWFEWQADRQLNAFVRSDREPGSTLRTGLWKYSRHPNYLGEILIWWSLYLFGMAADPEWAKWSLWAPTAMTAMFLFASIPMLEKRSLERRSGYQQVIDETSMLIPLPPRRSKPKSGVA